MTLMNAPQNVELNIAEINTNDEALKSFLFSLGCYSGETIVILNRRRSGCIVVIKDGRYHIDKYLANLISV